MKSLFLCCLLLLGVFRAEGQGGFGGPYGCKDITECKQGEICHLDYCNWFVAICWYKCFPTECLQENQVLECDAKETFRCKCVCKQGYKMVNDACVGNSTQVRPKFQVPQ